MCDLVVMTDTMLYVPQHLLYDEDLGEASEQMFKRASVIQQDQRLTGVHPLSRGGSSPQPG